MVKSTTKIFNISEPPIQNEVTYSADEVISTKRNLASNTRYRFLSSAMVRTGTSGMTMYHAFDKQNIEFLNPRLRATSSGVIGGLFERCRDVKILDEGSMDIQLIKGGTNNLRGQGSCCIWIRDGENILVDGGNLRSASRGVNARSSQVGVDYLHPPDNRMRNITIRNVNALDFSNEPISVNRCVDSLVEKTRSGNSFENPIDIGFSYLTHVRNFECVGAQKTASGIHYDQTRNAVVHHGVVRDSQASAMQVYLAQNVEIAFVDILNSSLDPTVNAAAVNIIGNATHRARNIYLHDCNFSNSRSSDIWINNAENIYVWNCPGARISVGSAVNHIFIDGTLPPNYNGLGSMFENNMDRAA